MADATIAIDEPAVTDKLLDCESLTVSAQTVYRERMRVAGAAATDLAPVSSTAGLKVDLGADNDVTVTSGTITTITNVVHVDDNSSSLTVDGAVTVTGAAAADAAVSGNPVLVAGYGSTATPSAMSADGDVTRIWTTRNGAVNVADAGGSLTVDGTVAATQSGTWDVGTVTSVTNVVHVDDNSSSLSVDDGGGSITVDASSLPLPTGAATSAKQDTQITSLQTIDDPVATIGTTPLFRVAVFDDADNQITSFGGSGGSGTEYTEDAAAAANPVGGVTILVRADTPAGITSANGDNVAQRGTDYGAAYVTLLDTSGNAVSVGGGAQYTEGDTDASITGTAMLWEDGSDTLRAVSASKPLPVGDAGGSLTVDGSVTVTQGTAANLNATVVGTGTFATQATLQTGSNTIGKLAANSGVDIGDVDVTSLPNVTLAAGTNTNEVVGDAAHDAAVAGNPLRIGARADTALSGITLVAAGDTTDLYAGVDGVLIVRPHCNLEDIVTGIDTDTDGASSSCIAAQGSGVKVYITRAIVANSHASTFATVDLRDGTAGSVKATLPAPASGGGMFTFDPPIPFSANTAVAVDPSAAVSTITTTLIGFKSKV